jgi:hypothetical protein
LRHVLPFVLSTLKNKLCIGGLGCYDLSEEALKELQTEGGMIVFKPTTIPTKQSGTKQSGGILLSFFAFIFVFVFVFGVLLFLLGGG